MHAFDIAQNCCAKHVFEASQMNRETEDSSQKSPLGLRLGSSWLLLLPLLLQLREMLFCCLRRKDDYKGLLCIYCTSKAHS